LYDNPGLNTRLWPGNDPIRIVVDRELRLPTTTKVFDGRSTTIVFNLKQHTIPAEWIYQPADPKSFDVGYYQVTNDVSLIHQMIHALYEMKIQSVLVEGGALLLQSFIDEALWDEARIITNTKMHISNGLPAPVLHNERLVQSHQLLSDTIQFFTPATQNP
ncbi:MAG TPA: dihydrofolate reductase family protein, partial [Flavisolibacter sp.]|nr:dihydrofolate reductase family protein [Flavisolibacter sp.]